MGLEDFKKTVIRNMIVKLLSLASIFIFVKTRQDVGIYILILSLSQLLGNITLWPYLPKLVYAPRIHDLKIFRHLKPSLALFIPQVATTIYLAVNKTMLWKLSSVTASGYYDYSDKLVKLVLAIVTSTGTVMLPHVANLYANKQIEKVKQYLYTSFDFVLAISIPMAFGIASVATALAPWFFGKAFTSVNILLIIESPVIILIGQSNVIGQQYLLPTKQMSTYTTSVVLGAITNIVINIPLILRWGVYGAMVATLLSELTVTLYQLIMVRKSLRISSLFVNFFKYLIAGVTMFIPVYILNITMNISTLNLILEILVGLLIYVGVLLILQPSIIYKVKAFRTRK